MFISATREKILRLFFNEPRLTLHQRGISRRANVVPHNVNKYLKEFVGEGLLLRSKIPQFTLYRVNVKNEFLFKVFEEFELERRKNFFKRNGLLSRMLPPYVENLVHSSDRDIQMVILLGPAVRTGGMNRIKIEILTATSASMDRKRLSRAYQAARRKVGPLLEIIPVSVTFEEMVEGFGKKMEFYEKLWKNRIVLYNESLFWRLVKEGKLCYKSSRARG
jgi:hypothetical protein